MHGMRYLLFARVARTGRDVMGWYGSPQVEIKDDGDERHAIIYLLFFSPRSWTLVRAPPSPWLKEPSRRTLASHRPA